MTGTVDTWVGEARRAIEAAAGVEGRQAVEATWAAQEREPRPVVAVFGPYDSGKTSLLKRLLVDESRPVPEWATVSGRRETFEVQAAEVCGCTVLDTPGISGGNAEHEALAREPLARADAILLVVPPQLITAEKDLVVRIVSGAGVRSGGLPLGKSLLVAVGRMDEAGRDPSDDLPGYRDLCARKTGELIELFRREGIDVAAGVVFPLAGDPYQQVGNGTPTSKEVYDEFRSWDGVGALADALRGLAPRLPLLRRAACVRFHCEEMAALMVGLEDRLQKVAVAAAEAANGKERVTLIRRELDALSDAARTRLDQTVEEQVASVVRSGFMSAEDVKQQLEPRMQKAFERWRADHEGQLLKLAARAQGEIASRMASPAGKTLKLSFDETPSEDRDHQGALKQARKLGAKMKQLLRERDERQIGMKMSKARDELKRLEDAGSFEKYRDAARRTKAFRTAEQAEKAGKVVTMHAALDVLGPLVAELGPLILDEVARRRREQERRDRRAALRADVERASRDVSAECWAEWTKVVKEFEDWLDLQAKPYETALPSLEEETAALQAQRARLSEVVQSAPVEQSSSE